MKFGHVLSEVFAQPWMIQPEKLDAICRVVAVRAEMASADADVKENWSGRAEQPQAYVICDDGVQYRAGADCSFGDLLAEASRGAAAAAGASSGPKLIAVLPITGTIFPKANLMMDFSGGTSVQDFTQKFRQAVASPDVKAIVLDIDSPGGSVYGIDELASEIYAARAQKKIVAQVSPLAASAAYYLASQASDIAVTASGEVGSIGVRMAHADYSEQLKQKGVNVTEIAAGKYKTEGSPYAPLGEEAKAFQQQRVNEYYDAFVGAVARGREVSKKDVRDGFGQGRVVGAAEAKRLGMVDRVATLDETIARLGGDMSKAVQMSAGEAASVRSSVVGGEGVPTNSSFEVRTIPATADEKTEVMMSEANASAAAVADLNAVRQAAIDADKARIAALQALARDHAGVVTQTQLSAWINDGTTAETASGIILQRFAATAKAVPHVEVVDRGTSAEALTEQFRKAVAEDPKRNGGGMVIVRSLKAFAKAKGDMGKAIKFAGETFGDKLAATVLSAGSQADGGFAVPDVLADDFIEFLRPQAVVRSLNPAMAPLERGSLNIAKMTGGSTATYIGENGITPETKPLFGQVKATAKKLAALVPISNDLIRYSGGRLGGDGMVRDDLVAAFAQGEDSAFIRGAGTAFTPKGLRNWCTQFTAATNTSTGTLANARAGLSALKLALRKANVKFRRAGWIMSPRTENFLMWNAVDGNGNLVFNAEMRTGMLLGFPYRVTTLIPENLNSSTETEVYLADFADVVIAENPQIVFNISTEASYTDGGSLVSAFERDQTVIQMIVEHDLVVRHVESIAILGGTQTGPTWT
jgi:HK97 family phage major capsid protein